MHVDHLPAREASPSDASFDSMTIPVRATLTLLLVGACSRIHAPTGDEGRTSIAVDPVRRAAKTSSDAGQAQSHVATAVESAPESLRSPLMAIHESLSSVALASWQVVVDGAGRKDRLGWLARDFGTSAFSRADRIDEGLLQTRTPEGALHLGLLVIHFRECKNLAKARAAVAKSGRTNFKLPVLTIFRTKARGHEMIFVLSETPVHSQIDALLKNIDLVLKNDSPCSERE